MSLYSKLKNKTLKKLSDTEKICRGLKKTLTEKKEFYMWINLEA
jgi:hypothetical protein